jgi:hypothetical protein
LAVKPFGIKQRNFGDAANAVAEGCPIGIHANPVGRDCADAGDDYSFPR